MNKVKWLDPADERVMKLDGTTKFVGYLRYTANPFKKIIKTMITKKALIKQFEERIEKLEEANENDKQAHSCAKCKCLILERDAIRGKSKINELANGWPFFSQRRVEEIERVFYCHKCAPKELTAKK